MASIDIEATADGGPRGEEPVDEPVPAGPGPGPEPAPQPEAEPGAHEPLWVLLGREELTTWETCRVAGCTEDISPVDVYCPDVNHADLLLFPGLRVGPRRWWAVNLARTIVVGLVVAAASYETRWPIYLLAAGIGLACIGLPLHAHRLARTVALVGWSVITVVAGVIAAADIGTDGMRLVRTLAVGVPLGLAALFATQGPGVLTREEPSGAEREAARGVAGSYLMAVLTAVTWWLTTGWLADSFVGVPEVARRWLLFAALGAVLGGFLMAAIGALLASFGVLDLDVEPRIRRLPRRHRVTWSYMTRPLPPLGDRATSLERVRRQVAILTHQMREQVKRSAVALVRGAINALLAFLLGGQRSLFRVVNWSDRRTRLFGRRLHFVVRRGRRIARTGVRYAARAVVRASGPLVAYGAAVVGALATLALADGFTRYLVDGSLVGLVTGSLWSAVGLGACFVVWERLASVTRTEAVQAEMRLLNRIAPDLALFTVAAGWVVGVPGTFGYGPIELGWVTVVGTAVLAILLVQEEISDRRFRRHEQPQPTAAGPSSPKRRGG